MHHVRNRAAAAVIYPRDVHIEQPLPRIGCDIRQQTGVRDPGVVHQQRHRAGLRKHPLDLLQIGHIGPHGQTAGLRRNFMRGGL